MITEQMIIALREQVSYRISQRRFNHTLGVERAAEFLARKCLPEKIQEARAAALLHDITKELSTEEHLDIVNKNGISLTQEEMAIPALLHSRTAPAVIKKDFPEFATEEILSAIDKHTTGSAEMTTFDKIVFLADFIEDSRTYPASLTTARFVKNSMKTKNVGANIFVLNQACVMEIDSTISHLKHFGKTINSKTLLARDALISKILLR